MGELWRETTIGEICDVRRGSSPRPIKDQRYFEGGDIPWIKIADATASDKYLYKTKQYVNEFGASFSRFIPKGSLILAASGTLGCVQMLGVPGCIHDGWLHLHNFKSADAEFLYYWLRLNTHLSGNAAYGAAIQNINTEVLRNFPILLPPLPVQLGITGILSAYDDLIEVNTRRIEALEEMARRTYEEWFVNYRFPSGDGKRPEEWQDVKLAEVADVNPTQIKPANAPNTIHYIDISSVSPGKIQPPKEMLFAEAPGRARRIIQIGDTIWSCVRPNRRSHALVGHLPANTLASTGFAVLRPRAVPASILYLATTTDAFVSYLVNSATGAAYPAVKTSDFQDADYALPTNSLMESFDRIASPWFHEKENLEFQNANLRTQRDLLLPRLISGAIDVSDAEAALEAAE